MRAKMCIKYILFSILLLICFICTVEANAQDFSFSFAKVRLKPPKDSDYERNLEQAIEQLNNTIIFSKKLVVLQNEKRTQDVMYYQRCGDGCRPRGRK